MCSSPWPAHEQLLRGTGREGSAEDRWGPVDTWLKECRDECTGAGGRGMGERWAERKTGG